ncbi:MAG: ADP-glyceromanno-heptose 6-epimerase [Proteobacteria bacterium]|nr:ADP-glyceromanno-heptose 6-epimerase [Pseudomonadota bacterium]
MKTILVTGGGGFIGSNLVAALLERGTHDVVVCDRFGNSDKWRNLGKHPVSEIIEPGQMFAWLDANRSRLEMIFHLGAKSSTVEKNIDMVLENNFALSLNLWRWCDAAGVRLLYASSSATYGDGSQGFDDNMDLEYMGRLKPMSGYGWSKHLFDMHVARATLRGQGKLPQWVGLKFFNVYGPNEYHKDDQRSVIAKIVPQALQGAAVRLFRSYNDKYPDGGQMRDVLYVKDAVQVLLWFLDNPDKNGLYNLGTGRAVSFNDMAKAIFNAIGRTPNIHYFDMPESLIPNYQYFTEANIQKLRTAGYVASFSTVEDGVRDFVQHYLLQPDAYR